MRYLRTYEKNSSKLQVGDYAVISFNSMSLKFVPWNYYVNNNVCQIYSISKKSQHYTALIEVDDSIYDEFFIHGGFTDYENPKQHIQIINGKRFINLHFDLNHIRFFSKSKEECELFLNSSKYNI
jgi:hypothetical protein